MKKTTNAYSITTPFGTITRNSARAYDFVIFRILRDPRSGRLWMHIPGNTGGYRFTETAADKTLHQIAAANSRFYSDRDGYVQHEVVGAFAYVTQFGAAKGLKDEAVILRPEYMPAPAVVEAPAPQREARARVIVWDDTGRRVEEYRTISRRHTEDSAARLQATIQGRQPEGFAVAVELL